MLLSLACWVVLRCTLVSPVKEGGGTGVAPPKGQHAGQQNHVKAKNGHTCGPFIVQPSTYAHSQTEAHGDIIIHTSNCTHK